MLKRTLIILNNAEIDVLNKIARKTNMDCWFRLELNNIDDPNSGYIVYDIEKDIVLEVDEAIMCLLEGLDCKENWVNCDLTQSEQITFLYLCQSLNIVEHMWERLNEWY